MVTELVVSLAEGVDGEQGVEFRGVDEAFIVAHSGDATGKLYIEMP